jgi:hypothetical protein
MERFEIPVWINILSVVVSVFLVYLLAKRDAKKQGRGIEKPAELKTAETGLRSMEKAPAASQPSRDEPVLKKAA